MLEGISSEYELPSLQYDRAWTPYEKGKKYDIPDSIYDQMNNSEINLSMGLFAEINHGWVAIDNALYLWDYTQTNPELLGYEDQPNAISAVKLIVPRAGVFVPSITHILVVATLNDIHLIGVSASQGPTGAKTVSLYDTGMSQSTKGVTVSHIAASTTTGRIFFAGSNDNELYELTYQQEEKWFASRCAKVNHTSPGYTALLPGPLWTPKSSEKVIQIVVDDSRNLVYTLSSTSAIRVFHMDSPTTLNKVIEKSRQEILRDISHMIQQTPILDSNMAIVSINPISAREAGKIHLMAVTSTGCRIFLSATRGYGYMAGRGEVPTSMQVQHIKFPPKEQHEVQQRSPGQAPTYANGEPIIDTRSEALKFTQSGHRFPPGLFLAFLNRGEATRNDVLFLSAPDTGRMALAAREPSVQGIKYFEAGTWMAVDGKLQDIGLATKPFAAANSPVGFGNELAVQYDDNATEIAILTNSGIQIVRRRRLVDIFAAAIRYGGGEEGLEGEMRKFIKLFGRGEATAAALAVACGQGADISSSDARVVKVTDPATLEAARKAFVEHGGRPTVDVNGVSDGSTQAIDQVRPSARHEGLGLYITRIVRSLWKAPVVAQTLQAQGGAVTITSTMPIDKLKIVQDDLAKLDAFLEKNSSFIEGLSGPEGLHRVGSKQEEIALQGEHQALYSLQTLNKSIIEGISFVLMLFDERVDELFASLDDTTKQRLRELTYESLFASDNGKDLGKVLVKAIVNRNIANGSNVDTVADALRRKCKSFCSAGDVMIFKAQEQLKRASELGANTDLGRNVLNESLRLFNQVAGDLTPENLQATVNSYVDLQFFAGAVQLSLNVAKEVDRGNKALHWANDGKPEGDPRAALYNQRMQCYELIHKILTHVDQLSRQQPETTDGRTNVIAVKRDEAYNIVNQSTDELFQFDLFDWYLKQGWEERILEVESDFVITYLQKLSGNELKHADLLWRYHAHKERYYQAALVQEQLARSDFVIPLQKRIEYLSRAKANSSTHTSGVGRSTRQVLQRSITDLLDIANIQDEVLQRIRGDARIVPEVRERIIKELDGQILSLSEVCISHPCRKSSANMFQLFNQYVDPANYFSISLEIYHSSGYRNQAEVLGTWEQLLEREHHAVLEQGDSNAQQPYEHIVSIIIELAQRIGSLPDLIFGPNIFIPLLERYRVHHQRDVSSPYWVMDLCIDIGIAYEQVFTVLNALVHSQERPFVGTNRRLVANDLVYITGRWLENCLRINQRLFGGYDQAAEVQDTLRQLLELQVLQQPEIENARDLRERISRNLI